MQHKRILSKIYKTGWVPGIALLTMLTGCIGYVQGPAPRAGIYVPAPVVETTVVVQDDYIYYPAYQVYYSSSRQQCLYLQGGAWIARPTPPNVSIDVLFASPSVRLDFHDSPAHHHAAVVQQYPRNWSPGGSNQDQKRNGKNDKRDKRDDHRDDQRDDHQNNGRGPG